uniref:Uncharacterized protein n=1 Tax=Glossina austeni TaxID=7395 RepID=A0A1A9VS20_GLOAU
MIASLLGHIKANFGALIPDPLSGGGRLNACRLSAVPVNPNAETFYPNPNKTVSDNMQSHNVLLPYLHRRAADQSICVTVEEVAELWNEMSMAERSILMKTAHRIGYVYGPCDRMNLVVQRLRKALKNDYTLDAVDLTTTMRKI